MAKESSQARPGTHDLAVVALELEQRFLLRATPVVRGAQVVDGELGQADLQCRGAGEPAGGVGAQSGGRPRVTGEALAVLAMRVDDEHPVAAVGLEDAAGEDLHEVGLAHARGGEDAHMAGERRSRDADAEVDLGLAAAQVAEGEVAHAAAQELEVGGLG